MKTNLQFLSKIKALILLFILINFSVFSQIDSTKIQVNKKSIFSSFDLGADIKSRYIWRGISLGGNTPSIQPSIELNITKGWIVGIWGAYSFGEHANQEVDLYFGYTTSNEKLSFLLTDYYFPDYSKRNGDYFNYDSNSGHVYELMVSALLFNNFPLGFTIATNFYGSDKKINNEGETTDDQSYSTYIEANYATTIATIDLSFFTGFVLGN